MSNKTHVPRIKVKDGVEYTVYELYNKKNKLIKKENIQEFLNKGGITEEISNLKVWQQAFTNKSYSNYIYKSKYYKYIDKDAPLDGALPIQKKSNETLEWLGDAFIQSIVSSYLAKRFKKQNEGFLTKIRSKLVKTESLSKIAKYLKLEEYLLISKNVEILSNGRNNAKLLEDLFESFIGAFMTDFTKKVNEPYAYSLCKKFIINCIQNAIDLTDLIRKDDNYKDQLMRYFQKHKDGVLPKYKMESSKTINNKNGSVYKNFVLNVYDSSNNIIGTGSAMSKKEAEQKAAKNALQHYGIYQN